jgi:hypothetical protein
MKNNILSILLLMLIPSMLVNAQTKDANISFNSEMHDFGKFNEADGPVTHKFEFTNTGSIPLMIKQVHASCGCTSPSWSKEPVLPGKTGFVAATYNPQNRPGPFSKTISLVSNASTPNKVLTIKGDVVPKPKTIEDIYRYSMGKIRLKTNHMSFARVIKEREGYQTVDIVNISEEPVSIAFRNLPGHISMTAKPAVLQPGQKGILEGTYNSKLKDDWGFVVDRVDMLLDDKFEAANRLTVSATIEEDFGSLTAEQRAQAPKIAFSGNTFNFEDIKQGDNVEHTFTITNNGKSDLIIRKIKASCGCTAVNPADDVIAGGGSTTMKVIFNSAGKVGKQNKTITVITNDPLHPRSILWVKGNVSTSPTP